VLLQREGWKVNAKRIYRIYSEEGLTVRTPQRKKLASRTRVPLPAAVRPNQRWSMDFMAARLHDNRLFRILTVVDQYTRECVALIADQRMNGSKVSIALSQAVEEREATPESITVDNGSEFASKVLDAWATQRGVRLNFIRPGRPVENAYASDCTPFERSGMTEVAGRRSDSFVPWAFRGISAPGGSYRCSGLSV
jgi:putative transposase